MKLETKIAELTTHTTTPRVYVGTYGKYAAGSIAGAWLNLDDYASAEDFAAACAELHKDERDPEIMLQDFEGFPRAFYGESGLDPKIWGWIALDEDERETVAVYMEAAGYVPDDLADAIDAFAGKADTLADFAADLLESTGELDAIPDNLRFYFDFEAYARDLRMGGDVITTHHEGDLWVFWNR